MNDPRIETLPKWAQAIIQRLECQSEPLVEEAAKCRREATNAKEWARKLSTANAALLELLGKAGQAGLDWAAITVSVLEGYEIFKQENPQCQ